MQAIIQSILHLSTDVRYVAVYRDGRLESDCRTDLAHTSSSESDKYEEMIVNPTLLTLVRQRGNIDCGGLEYVVIRYGSFFEVVAPVAGGCVSVGLEPTADLLPLVPKILAAASAGDIRRDV